MFADRAYTVTKSQAGPATIERNASSSYLFTELLSSSSDSSVASCRLFSDGYNLAARESLKN